MAAWSSKHPGLTTESKSQLRANCRSCPTTNLTSVSLSKKWSSDSTLCDEGWCSPGMQSGSVGVSVLPWGHGQVHCHYQRRRGPRRGVHGPQALLRAQAAARRLGSPMQAREGRGGGARARPLTSPGTHPPGSSRPLTSPGPLHTSPPLLNSDHGHAPAPPLENSNLPGTLSRSSPARG